MARGASKRKTEPRRVRDVMVPSVVTVDVSATLLDVATRMRDDNVGMLPVMEDAVVRGIITDRDLVVRAMTRDVRPSEVGVRECLSEPPRCAESDWSVEDALEAMADEQVGRLPVVDPAGGVVGVVTLSSLALRSSKRGKTLEAAQVGRRRRPERSAFLGDTISGCDDSSPARRGLLATTLGTGDTRPGDIASARRHRVAASTPCRRSR